MIALNPHLSFLVAALGTLVLTGMVYFVARRFEWLDHPIGRSSHTVATPTSGGLALALVLPAVAWMPLAQIVERPFLIVLAGGAIAAIGLVDDLRPLGVLPRLLVHAVGVALALGSIGAVTTIDIGSATLEFGVVGIIAVWLAGIWFVNLFNFMDGIDGIASAEAVFIGVLAGALVLESSSALAAAWWALGGAALGLLFWGWPVARIFMGDVGSGFLGFMIAVLLICSVAMQALNLPTALVLVAPFLCDTTLTLLRRMMRGEAWYAGHRLHAYQHLSRRWRSHLRVTTASIALNLALVAPAAWVCHRFPATAPWVAGATFAIICVLAIEAGAGSPESHGESRT